MKLTTRYTLLFAALLGIYGTAYAGDSGGGSGNNNTTTMNVTNKLKVDNEQNFTFKDNETTNINENLEVNVNIAFEVNADPAIGAVAISHDAQKLLKTIPSGGEGGGGGGGEGGGCKHLNGDDCGKGDDEHHHEQHGDKGHGEDPSTTTISDSVNNNSGNVGANFASGYSNQQENDTAIAKNDAASWKNDGYHHHPKIAVAADAGYEQMIDGLNQSFGPHRVGNTTVVMTNSAGSNDKGNIGINAAAGFGNQQKNDLAIAVQDNEDDPAVVVDAHAGGSQWLLGTTANAWGVNNTALLKDSVNSNTGNVGVNVAAGGFNQQANALAVATADATKLSKAVAGGMQVGAGNKFTGFNVNNCTTVEGSINGNTGNVGVNVTSGYGNMQANNLAISAPKN